MSIKIPLNIIAESTKALRDIDRFSKQSAKSLSGVERSFSQLKVLAGAVGAVFAGRAIVNGIKELTAAAAKQEDAINSLNTALALAGNYSREASKDIQNFASELQRTTTIGDESTLELFALARTFARSNEEAKRLTRAAIELNAAGLTSLEGGVRNLGKTFSGLTGELGESLPAIRGLTVEALKSGQAIDLVLSRFGGAAQAKVKTFSGAMEQLSNIQGDFSERLGELIIKNPLVITGINNLSGIFLKLSEVVQRNQKSIILFINNAIIELLKKFDFLVKAAGQVIKAFKSMQFIFKAAGRSIGALLAILSSFRGEMSFQDSVRSIKEISNALQDDLLNDLKDTAKGFKSTDATVKVMTTTLGDYVEKLEDVKDNTDLVTNSIKNQNKASQQITETAQEIERKLASALKNPIEVFIRAIQKGLTSLTSGELTVSIAAAAGAVGQGEAGAASLLKGGATAAGTALGGTAGGEAAGIFFDLLNQQQDQLGKNVDAFAQAAVDIPIRIAENVPFIIERFVQNIPKIIERFIAAIPSLITTFVENLISLLPTIATELITSLVAEAPRFVAELIKAIPKAIGQGISSGIGGIISLPGKILGGIGDIFGFADGGKVPDALRFSNDSMPARLSAGERVLDRETNRKFEQFVDQMANPSPTLQPVTIKIGEQDLANVLLRLDRKNIRAGVS